MMRCPYCGAILSPTDNFCHHCRAAVGEVATFRPGKKSLFTIFLAIVLILTSGAGIWLSFQQNIRLAGTWRRHIQTESTKVLVLQQYEFTPFGVMSYTSGDVILRGKYQLEGNVIQFTPSQTENDENTVDYQYQITLFGKMYVNGDLNNPYVATGISPFLIFFPSSLLMAVIGLILLIKKPKPIMLVDDDEDEDYDDDDEEDEDYDEEDEEDALSADIDVTFDTAAPVFESSREDSVSIMHEPPSAKAGAFQQGGDL